MNHRSLTVGFGFALCVHGLLLWIAATIVFVASRPAAPIRVTLLRASPAGSAAAASRESEQRKNESQIAEALAPAVSQPKPKPKVAQSRLAARRSKPSVDGTEQRARQPSTDAPIIADSGSSTVEGATEAEGRIGARPGTNGPGRARSDGGDLRVICAHCPKPVYPRIARLRGWEGIVDLEVLINADGTVASARIAQSSKHAALDEAALSVARESRFRVPAEGQSEMQGRIAYAFRLTD